MPFAGHITPMAAIAGELARDGHEVVGYTGAKYRGRFEGVGARWLAWTAAQDYDDAAIAETFPRIGSGKGMRADRANLEDVLLGTGAGQAADIVAAHRETPFDLIVVDQLAFGGALAAELLGLPWATVAITPLGLASRDLPPPGLRLRPARGPVARGRDAVLRSMFGLLIRRVALAAPCHGSGRARP
jgi:UDP:flavonoid glycosyltransferase YjiC (YdhE family)